MVTPHESNCAQMSFNLSVLTRDFAICATDRRLTRPTGGIVTERSNKLSLFHCADGHGFVTYCGIGSDFRRRTPSDWIADMPELGGKTIDEMAAAIKADSDRRLAVLARRGVDVRHSFVMGGFKLGVPFALLISNFDSLDGEERSEADPTLSISGKMMNVASDSPHPYLVVATGAKPRHPTRIKVRLLPQIRAGASAKVLRRLIVKTVRDVAYQDNRKASVGSSVQSVVIARNGSHDIAGHIPGGSSLLEGPNMVGPNMAVRDMYIDISDQPKWRYDPKVGKAKIEEIACSNCGAPVPEGYRLCGVCSASVQSKP